MGISGAINHDAAVATVHDGEILFAGHSERYSKKKNDPKISCLYELFKLKKQQLNR